MFPLRPCAAVLALLLSGVIAAQTPPAPAPPAPAPPAPAPPAPPPSSPAPPAVHDRGITPASAAPAAPGPLPMIFTTPRAPARASELLGTPVTDFSGRSLGTVFDLVIPGSDEMVALVKRSAGDLACVPLSRLLPRLSKAAPDDGKAGEARPAPDADKSAPTSSVESFVFSEDPARLAAAEAIESAAAVDAAAVRRCRESFLGREAVAGPAEGESACQPLLLARILAGNVKDSEGKEVGTVRDVAVNLARSRVAYVVVATSAKGNRVHGAAIGLLRCGEEGASLVLPLTARQLKAGTAWLDLERLPMEPDLPSVAPAPVVETPRS